MVLKCVTQIDFPLCSSLMCFFMFPRIVNFLRHSPNLYSSHVTKCVSKLSTSFTTKSFSHAFPLSGYSDPNSHSSQLYFNYDEHLKECLILCSSISSLPHGFPLMSLNFVSQISHIIGKLSAEKEVCFLLICTFKPILDVAL